MKVLRSLHNSSYLVIGRFWSSHIISVELFDQLTSFVSADTAPPPSMSAKNAILVSGRARAFGFFKLGLFTVIVQKAWAYWMFLIMDYKMAD